MIQTIDALIDSGKLVQDNDQQVAIDALSQLEYSINQTVNKKKSFRKANNSIYFYGRVGRGKTMLMDLFYQQISSTRKLRIHFHRFMQQLHKRLATTSGIENPVQSIVDDWFQTIDILCFDEFYVSDIGDAMLLKAVLQTIFEQKITLVVTSNCHPDQLFSNRLQRERFLPSIELIKQHCQLISIDGDQDHREIAFNQTLTYRDYFIEQPSDSSVLEQRFVSFTNQPASAGTIVINQRTLNTFGRSKNVIGFDFFEICSGPRSQLDYIWLADHYSIVMVSGVPAFSGNYIPAVFSGIEDCYQRDGVLLGKLTELDDEARRFMALVDELYDRQVRLIVSSCVEIEQLYQGEELAFEFQRCKSRLLEMQTIDYSTS